MGNRRTLQTKMHRNTGGNIKVLAHANRQYFQDEHGIHRIHFPGAAQNKRRRQFNLVLQPLLGGGWQETHMLIEEYTAVKGLPPGHLSAAENLSAN